MTTLDVRSGIKTSDTPGYVIVKAIIVDGNTITDWVQLTEGTNMTIDVTGNTVQFSAAEMGGGTTRLRADAEAWFRWP